MAGVELRSRAQLRSNFRDCLQIHRPQSKSRINSDSIVLGQRCAAADLFLGAAMVSPHAWPHLSHRIRFALGPSRWACWQQRNVAGKSVSDGRSAASRGRRLFSFADTLLVRLEQCVSTFPLRWGRSSFVASNFRCRPRAFTGRAFCLLPVARHCRTSVFQLSMGCPPAGGWLFVDLSCAMATMAAGPFVVARIGDPGYSDLSYSLSGLTSGFVLAQVPSLQINAYVRRR